MTRIPAAWVLAASLAWSALPPAGQASLQAEEGPSGERHFVSPSISPNGKWLCLLITEMEGQGSDDPEGFPSWRTKGRRLYRVALAPKKPKVVLLQHQREPNPKTLVWITSRMPSSALILDDGTIVALKDDTNLAKWNPAGKFSEQKIFEPEDRFYRELYLTAGGKKFILNRRTWGISKTITNDLLDLKTGSTSKLDFLKGLLGHPLHWTPDLKHVYGLELVLVPRTITLPDGKVLTQQDEKYRLVRVSAQKGERLVLAPAVPTRSVCFGKDSILWSARAPQGRDAVWRSRMSIDVQPEQVSTLNGWWPVLALEDDKFLLRSGTEVFGVVNFAPASPAEPKMAPAVTPLTLPPHDHIVYSPPLDAFVLSKDGVTWSMVDLSSKELWKFQLSMKEK